MALFLPSPTSSPNTFALPTSPPSACHLLPPRSGWFVFYTHQRNCSHSFLLPPPDLPGCLLVSVETGKLTGIALLMGLVVMHLYPTIRLMVAWLQIDHLLPELPVHTPAWTSTNMGGREPSHALRVETVRSVVNRNHQLQLRRPQVQPLIGRSASHVTTQTDPDADPWDDVLDRHRDCLSAHLN